MAKKSYTADELRLKLEEYFDDCYLTGDIPTKIGMIDFINISNDTLADWRIKKKNTHLKHINWATRKIELFNLQRYLKSSPNASAWYLERAYQEKYSLKTKVDINTNNGTPTPIIIQVDNKGKNKC